MIYLSRLILNPRSRQVQREIANPYEMHRTIMHAFAGRLEGDGPGGRERVLFRLEIHPRTGTPTLLVQSRGAPDWSWLVGTEKNYLLDPQELPLGVDNPAVKPVTLSLSAGQALAFRLLANPTVKKVIAGEKNGRRVGLYREEEQLEWLGRKVAAAGGRLLSARVEHDQHVNGNRYQDDQRQDLCFLSVQFEGCLQVVDPECLVQAVEAGIGSGKGLGFGLLSLAPAQV